MDIGPIWRAMLKNKAGFVLIALQIAVTMTIMVNAFAIIQERANNAGRDSGLDRRRDSERPGVPAEPEMGSDPIREPVLLPQVEVESAGERATEDRVEQEQGKVIGRRLGHADVAHADLGLHCPGPVHDFDTATFMPWCHRYRIRGFDGTAPCAEAALDKRLDFPVIDVSNYDQPRAVQPEMGPDPIREAVLLPQVEVEPAGEGTAEDRVVHQQGKVIGRRLGYAHVAHTDFGLYCSGPVHDFDTATFIHQPKRKDAHDVIACGVDFVRGSAIVH